MFSEERLKLTQVWFTGEEWENGTAGQVLRLQFNESQKREQLIEDAKPLAQKARELKDRKARKWANYQAYKKSLC
jgi:hypothetical protein